MFAGMEMENPMRWEESVSREKETGKETYYDSNGEVGGHCAEKMGRKIHEGRVRCW